MKRIVPFLTITTIAVAVGMSSSVVTWASTEALIKTGQTPDSTAWTADASIAKNSSGSAKLTVSEAPMSGNVSYNIDQPGFDGYEFQIDVTSSACAISGTELDPKTCITTDQADAGSTGRLCGTGTGPIVYKVEATSSISPSDDTLLNCEVSVSRLGENVAYVPKVDKLELEHIQYVNWNSDPATQGKPGSVKAYSSPTGRHYLAIGEIGDDNLPFFGPAVQTVRLFVWDENTEQFKLNSTIERVTGEVTSAISFFTELENENADYFQVARTLDANRNSIGKSYIQTYFYKDDKFVPHNTDCGVMNNFKNVNQLYNFHDTTGTYLLVGQKGSHYAGYNQKVIAYKYDGLKACYQPSGKKGSLPSNTLESIHSYIEDGTRYFLFANAHDHIRYTATTGVYKYNTSSQQFESASTVNVDRKNAQNFTSFPVTITDEHGNNPVNYTYLLMINGFYDFTITNPTRANTPESYLYTSQKGQIGANAAQHWRLPLYTKSWEHITLGGEHYFLAGFYQDPGTDRKEQIYGWCSAPATVTEGHWCYGKDANLIHLYDNLTIPGDSSTPNPLTSEWTTMEIDGETYVIRINNSKAGSTSVQVLKAAFK